MKKEMNENEAEYPFYLPALPYAKDALKPYINEETVDVHHFVLHKKYVDNLNAVLTPFPEYQRYSLVDLIQNVNKLPDSIKMPVFRYAGGVLNHNYYFDMMKPAPNHEPKGLLKKAINQKFESFEKFKVEFKAAAMTVFGSGWTWLVTDAKGKLSITNTENQVTPYSFGKTPIIPCDIWEHAYFLQYLAARDAYIDAWFSVADWDKAEELYELRVI